MKKLIFAATILLTVLLFSSCKQVEEMSKPNVRFKADGGPRLTYYLPKNEYRIEIKVVRNQLHRGPFVDYAGDYMRIDREVIKYDETNYEVVDAQIDLLAKPDPAEQYSILLNQAGLVPISLTQNGILAGVNTNIRKEVPRLQYKNCIPEKKTFIFTDLSVGPIVDITNKISYEYKKIDSALVRVPVENVETNVQSFQQLAWAAAKFISTIRESRFRLLAGLSEIDQIPENIQSRVEELNTLEKNYLELFIGHKERDTLIYYFSYSPETGTPDDEHRVLAYFSKINGLQTSNSILNETPNINNGVPLTLNVSPAIFAGSSTKDDIEQVLNKGVVYRIPSRANFSVALRDKDLANEQFPVSQWGIHAFLPQSVLNNTNKIEFDINTGGLINISNVLIPVPTKK